MHVDALLMFQAWEEMDTYKQKKTKTQFLKRNKTKHKHLFRAGIDTSYKAAGRTRGKPTGALELAARPEAPSCHEAGIASPPFARGSWASLYRLPAATWQSTLARISTLGGAQLGAGVGCVAPWVNSFQIVTHLKITLTGFFLLIGALYYSLHRSPLSYAWKYNQNPNTVFKKVDQRILYGNAKNLKLDDTI